MSRNLKIILTLKLILWIIIIFSLYSIYKWLVDSYKNDLLIDNITHLININEDSINNTIDVDTTKINNINEDIKGWIKVEGTNINYPFLQTNDNNYYLNHSIDKTNNNAGWIFLDYRNDINNLNKNTIIYGHNRLNNTMFGDLKRTLTNEWLNNQFVHYIKISTDKENSVWQIFSVYHIDNTSDYLYIDFNNDEDYKSFIDLITDRSIYNFNNKPTTDDYIITLSTCYIDNERTVVHGKLIMKEG